MFRPGSKLVHPFNPELGVGLVRQIEGRFLTVFFPEVDREVVLSATGAGLTRLVLPQGSRARLLSEQEDVVIAEARGHSYLLADGREVPDADLWPLGRSDTPLERLATLELDSVEAFRNRLQGLELMELREAGGLGSFLGGRVQLFPHQLHAAMRAVDADPVRWLLADEVGLGKTVEACLILSALVRTGRAERALVIAPSTLTIQWLGELYRKFHQVFVLLDNERIESVELDYGEGVNPFEVHPLAVISLELLASDARLLGQAQEAGLELVVLDEAHRLVGEEITRALGPLVRGARHALLLTATPLQSDRRGFFSLLSLLHPEAFESFEAFDAAVESEGATLPCTTAVRREDVGGLPPRVPLAVELPPPGEELSVDPRAHWIAAQATAWREAGEKALVFVRERATLEELRAFLEGETGTRVTVFHEDLLPAKRDLEIAAFRESGVPILLSTEAGGEGRNFQFCDRMVHFDLPLDPVELEQRIGRLDRIGRNKPVEIVYFRHAKAEVDLAGLYERLELFSRPAAGLDSALACVGPAIEAAMENYERLDVDALVSAVEEARDSASDSLTRVFYPDAYRPEQAAEVLARVPDDLEDKTQAYCIEAAEDLGFECLEKGGAARFYIEFGSGATVDAIPGVPGGSRFLGTFDREEAIVEEEMDFFASGHPLVEGLLLELEDGVRGRATLMEVPAGRIRGSGMACVFKRGAEWEVVIMGADGEEHPEWRESFLEALPRARDAKPEKWGIGHSWAEGIRSLGARVKRDGDLVATAFFRAV
ncbi:MAG: DEAD/DEAH box helicase family protein [Deltaproteobacteria bacterium]|nr:DEAD/DEAH box helicase family protein [Deltaproteobacteria bacterium]